MNQLSQDDLQQFYNVLKKNGRLRNTERCGKELSDRTVRGCHITCRTALDKAVKDRLIRLNPAEGCKPPSVKKKEMQVLRIYKTKVNSKWMFPSPRKEDSPLDPASVRKQLCKTLERAGCKKLRFHDLRHPYVKHTTKIFECVKKSL